MRNLVKSTASIGVTELALIVVAFIRNKYLAVTIGPYGFGVYGLLSSFFSLVTLFTGTWLAYGATKYVAEFKKAEQHRSIAEVSFFSVGVSCALSIAVTLLFVMNRNIIIARFLSPEISPVYFILYSCSILALSLSPLVFALLQGLSVVKPVVLTKLFMALIEIGLVVSLVYVWHLDGFFLSVFLSSAVTAIVLVGLLRKYVPDKVFLPKFADELPKRLLMFGGANLVIGIFFFAGQYLLRIIVLQNMDIDSVGLLQAGISIFGYMGIVNRSSSYLFLPQMSEAMENAERNNRLNEYLRFTLLVNIPICFGTILFGTLLVEVLYSHRFLALTEVLNWFVIAHLMNSITSAFQFSILGKGLMKYYSAISIIGTVLLVICPILLVSRLGLTSVPLGYIVSYAGGLLLFYLYSVKKHGYKISNEVLLLLVVSAIAIGVSLLAARENTYLRILAAMLLTALLGKLIKKNEYSKAFAYVRSRLSRDR